MADDGRMMIHKSLRLQPLSEDEKTALLEGMSSEGLRCAIVPAAVTLRVCSYIVAVKTVSSRLATAWVCLC